MAPDGHPEVATGGTTGPEEAALPPSDSNPWADNAGNIAATLTDAARSWPYQRAVVFPSGRDAAGRVTYAQLTFAQLDAESDRVAAGLQAWGVEPGTRMVLMVRPGLDFIVLTFALFKAGCVVVLIDPGMGPGNVFRCLDQVEPQGFVALPSVQVMRCAAGRRFRAARWNVVVGGPSLGLGLSYRTLQQRAPAGPFRGPMTRGTDRAAIIFTSGSTGPAKGVVYEHGMFTAQTEALRDFYQIAPGELDLPAFPLFALFNVALGVTTVIPDMNPTRPARVDPRRIIEAIENQGITQSFGSPAIWNRVGRHAEEHGLQLPSLRRVLSAGAPVPPDVLRRMLAALGPAADIFTPYGATEALPVASIGAREVLASTAEKTRAGAGTCVGFPFPNIEIRIIDVTWGPIERISEARELPAGEVGEIIVRGPVVTREYHRQPEATRLAKIADGDRFWHRMGDVGYLDTTGRLWFCGRKAHIVQAAPGRMFTECCEPIFNTHPRVFRSALVGVPLAGPPIEENTRGTSGSPGPDLSTPRQPVIVIEPEAGCFPRNAAERTKFTAELLAVGARHATTSPIRDVLFHRSFPVDVRHNVKISREVLAVWAARQLGRKAARRRFHM